MNGSPGSAGRWAGAGAMAILAAASLAIRLTLGVPTLPELFADPLLYMLPPTLFSTALDLFHFAAKPILLAALLLGQVGVGALLGWLYSEVLAPKGTKSNYTVTLPVDGEGILAPQWTGGPEWEPSPVALRPALLLSSIAWLTTILVIFPAIGAGPFGILLSAGAVLTVASYFIDATIFGLTLAWIYSRLYPWSRSKPAKEIPKKLPSRRAMIRQIAAAIAVLLGVNVALEVFESLESNTSFRPPAHLPSPITPIDGFYVVAKDFFPVNVDLSHWQLTVLGSGGRSRQYNLDQLQARPSVELVTTLTCISNEIGGDLIGTARWTGVPLADLLREVGVDGRAREVVLSAVDNYADSIPVELAMASDTILVYAMDGQPLPIAHGFPLRAIIPGRYGIKNVKWLSRVEVVDHGFVGYWPSRGWTDQAVVQTESQIDLPADHSNLPLGPIEVGGIAFAGARGIRMVELSVDNGETWLPTTLDPPLSAYTWTTWHTIWRPASPGWYTLQVRATDGTGQVQTAVVTPPIPDGATGYHQIHVRVG
ncbi:MAG TPA: molybdopterin-dependent oxidoreductase [Chloroflexota bacterium]|nr:molybdopterin-dependent oxidoreductase [Chloroflexota bacterium]